MRDATHRRLSTTPTLWRRREWRLVLDTPYAEDGDVLLTCALTMPSRHVLDLMLAAGGGSLRRRVEPAVCDALWGGFEPGLGDRAVVLAGYVSRCPPVTVKVSPPTRPLSSCVAGGCAVCA